MVIVLPLVLVAPAGAVSVGDTAAGKAGALTIVRLLGSGVPEGQAWDPLYLRLRGGWERALLRLKASLEPASGRKQASGQKPPPVPKK